MASNQAEDLILESEQAEEFVPVLVQGSWLGSDSVWVQDYQSELVLADLFRVLPPADQGSNLRVLV